MRILLTGGAGFIGFHTAKLLHEQGNEVLVVDNMNDYYDIRLKFYRLKELQKLGISFFECDIENRDALEIIFSSHKIDCIVNLAARAGVRASIKNPHIYISTNVGGSQNLLEAARYHNIPKFILASSSSVYAGCAMPFTETARIDAPLSPYAASKAAAELFARTQHFLYGLDVTVFRFFTVFGPAGRPDMSYFRFIKQMFENKPLKIFGDGEQGRDFTFVEDIARGIACACNKNLGFEIINLGGSSPYTVNCMIGTLEKLCGINATIMYEPFLPEDMHTTWADISKAKQLLDWQPFVSFENGLEKTVQWFFDNRNFVEALEL